MLNCCKIFPFKPKYWRFVSFLATGFSVANLFFAFGLTLIIYIAGCVILSVFVFYLVLFKNSPG